MLPFLIISAFFFCHSGDDLIFDTVFSFLFNSHKIFSSKKYFYIP